jgi:hypothetical protein
LRSSPSSAPSSRSHKGGYNPKKVAEATATGVFASRGIDYDPESLGCKTWFTPGSQLVEYRAPRGWFACDNGIAPAFGSEVCLVVHVTGAHAASIEDVESYPNVCERDFVRLTGATVVKRY